MVLQAINFREKRSRWRGFLPGIALLAVFLLMTGLECRAEEWKVWNSGEESYTYLAGEDGTVSLIHCYCSGESLTLPETIEGYTVTGLGAVDARGQEHFFSISGSVRELVIPDSVRKVRMADMDSRIEKLHLGAGVEIVPSDSGYLAQFAALSKVTVSSGNSYYSAKDGVLYSKNGKILYGYPKARSGSSYKIKNGVQKIWSGAFSGCTQLESVTFDKKLREIGERAFENTNLKSVKLPGKVTKIGEGAFSDCGLLKTVSLSRSLKEIGDEAFSSCAELHTVKLPNSLKKIGAGAFKNCGSLTGTVTIPKKVEEIGSCAFAECTGITKFQVKNPKTVIGQCAMGFRSQYKGEDANGNGLYQYKSVKGVSVQCAVKSGAYSYAKKYGIAFLDDKGKKKLSYRKKTVKESVQATLSLLEWKSQNGTYVYELNTDGTAAVLEIRDSGGTLEIPEQIGEHTVVRLGSCGKGFDVNGTIRELILPETVEEVYSGEFASVSQQMTIRFGAKTLWIPASGETEGMFMGCGMDLVISSENPYYMADGGVVYSKDGKVLYSYPQSLKETSYTVRPETERIYPFAFWNCKNLEQITFSETLRVIGASSFGSTGLKQVSFPESLKTIGAFAFFRTPLSGTVTFPASVQDIQDCAFAGCSNVDKWIFNGNSAKLGQCAIGFSTTYDGDDAYVAQSVKKTAVVAPLNSKAYSYAKKCGLVFYDQNNQKKLSYHKKKERFSYSY